MHWAVALGKQLLHNLRFTVFLFYELRWYCANNGREAEGEELSTYPVNSRSSHFFSSPALRHGRQRLPCTGAHALWVHDSRFLCPSGESLCCSATLRGGEGWAPPHGGAAAHARWATAFYFVTGSPAELAGRFWNVDQKQSTQEAWEPEEPAVMSKVLQTH